MWHQEKGREKFWGRLGIEKKKVPKYNKLFKLVIIRPLTYLGAQKTFAGTQSIGSPRVLFPQ
jgi:hypothetical protein